jgi:zinc protease
MRFLLACVLAPIVACAGPGGDTPPPQPPAPAAAAPAPAVPIAPALVFTDEPFRAKQPPAGEPKDMTAPQLQTFKLAHGITAYLVERHDLPIVSLSLSFPGGAAVDPPRKEGLASVCAGLMSDGTSKLDKIAFEEALADIASNVNSDAGADRHEVSMSALSSNLDATLDLWADTLLRPGLRQDELDRSIKRRVAGLTQLKGSAAGLAGRLSGSVVYGPQHLHGRFATEPSYRALTIADCKRFVAERIKPEGAQLFVVGDITRADLTGKLASRLAGWSGKPRPIARVGKPRPRKGKLFFVDVPNAAQSVVQILALGPPRKAPDFQPTSIMSGILGGGFNSRINMNIREKHGYAYGAGSGFQYTREDSLFRASGSVRTNVTKESVQEMLKEIRGLASGDPTSEEVTREQDGRIQALPARFATGGQILGAFRELVYFGLPLDYWDSYVARVKAVDMAAVKKAAAKHLHPRDLQILVVGDGKTVLPKLEELVSSKEVAGPIVILDADGKPTAGATAKAKHRATGKTRAGRAAKPARRARGR